MFSLQSFAKLNLGLDVIKKRNDGFHDISSIMCKINLCDQIYFQESNKNEVFQEGITMEKNIVSKVLDYMTKEYSPSKKLKIIIEKKIPYSDYGTTFAKEWHQVFFHDPEGNIVEVNQKV